MTIHPIFQYYSDCFNFLRREPFPIRDANQVSLAFEAVLSQFSSELSKLEQDTPLPQVDSLHRWHEIQTKTPKELLEKLRIAKEFALSFFKTLLEKKDNHHFKLHPDTLVSIPENTQDLFHLALCDHKFEEIKGLGRGTYGHVALVKQSYLNLAQKTYDPQADTALNCRKALQRELCVYSTLSHRNIVKMLGCYVSTRKFYLFLEYMNNGSLHSYIDTFTKNPVSGFFSIPFSTRIAVALQLCEGVAYLHSRGFIHRDLSRDNVLVHQHGGELTVKISDMGFLADFNYKNSNLNPVFAAPESLNKTLTSTALDIYSVGMIIFLTFVNRYAYARKQKDNGELEENSEYRKRLYFEMYLYPRVTTYPIPKGIEWDREDPGEALRTPMAACLSAKPDFRPTADDLVKMLTAIKERSLT